MTKREFIEMTEDIFKHVDIETFIGEGETLTEYMTYWEKFKGSETSNKITEKGMQFLTFLNENTSENKESFSSKEIGEHYGISGRSVSGSMRKLVDEGYVTKIATSPIEYKITDMGRAAIDNN